VACVKKGRPNLAVRTAATPPVSFEFVHSIRADMDFRPFRLD
jgi:hypothetical protein